MDVGGLCEGASHWRNRPRERRLGPRFSGMEMKTGSWLSC